MNNIYVGIDLGTTNSTIAAFNGEAVSVIPNGFGENLTPSVVRIDKRGGVVVGRHALRYLESDPANTRIEFKRLMGTESPLAFPASGISHLPEELSAHVLSSLLSDAGDTLGFTPTTAVISTPALFELPQNHATMRAGKLAGLAKVLLIQEPVASAIAAGWREDSPGMWLIFDLGGGTLDISLLETRDGRLRVMDHSGDNFLGGKDFDNVLMDWALDRLRQEYTIAGLSRENPAARPALARLKKACEQAKIELSRLERSDIVIPDFKADETSIDVDLEIARSEYEELVAPLVQRGLAVCHSLLEKCRVSTDEICRVVFVGGPTMTPAIRREIGNAFAGRVATGIDPMTAVARGAALFAATAGLDAVPAPKTSHSAVDLAVIIEHPAVTADLEPYVVGRFLPTPDQEFPAEVLLCREDGATTPARAVGQEGSFVLPAALRPHCQNRFRLAATDANGKDVPLSTPEFAIVHGISIADPPLSRSVGVALADDTVQVYFKKGTPLPARRTFIHETIKSVSSTSGEDALSVPIVQGEFNRAHRNCLIGTLAIGGVGCSLPARSRVEVTLHLDRSGQLMARADIPSIGRTFDDVIHILVPTASLSTLEQGLTTAKTRSSRVLRQTFQLGNAASSRELGKIPERLAEARRCLEAARGGDDDAGQRLRRILLEIEGLMDSVEEELEWPDMVQEAAEWIEIALGCVPAEGTASEQALLERAIASSNAAVESRNPQELERQGRLIKSLVDAACARHPRAAYMNFDWYAGNIALATDIPGASALLDQGREAYDRDDTQALKSINRQLNSLFPGTEEERRRSFGSGVR